MKLLNIVSFCTLLAAGAACGCEQFALTFTERVALIFYDRSAYTAIITAFEDFASTLPDPYAYDDELYAQKFIEILISYEQGGFATSLPPTPPTDAENEGKSYWIFGLTACVNGLYNDYETYSVYIQSYYDACGFATLAPSDDTTEAPATATTAPANNTYMGSWMFPFAQLRGWTWESQTWQTLYSCYSFDTTGMTETDITAATTQCTQLTAYYCENPQQIPAEPEELNDQVGVSEFYYLIGYIFSSYEYRVSFASSFYYYMSSCASGPVELQWLQVIKNACEVKAGQSAECSDSGFDADAKAIEACVQLIQQLIAEGNVEILQFIGYYMETTLGVVVTPETETFSGTVEQYTYLFVTIAESCGMEAAGFQGWIDFKAEWDAYCSGKVDIEWSVCITWIEQFFQCCCDFQPIPTALPSDAASTDLPSEEPSSDLPTEFTDYTDFTEVFPTSGSCGELSAEEQCKYIINYFYFIAQLYIDVEWRATLNGYCTTFKEEKPDCTGPEKAKAFVDQTSKCRRDKHGGSGSGSGSKEDGEGSSETTGAASAAPTDAVTAAVTDFTALVTDGPAPSGSTEECSWELFIDFSIEIWLNGNWDLLLVGANTMCETDDGTDATAVVPTGSGNGSGSGSGEDECAQIEGPTGIFFFFEIIAIECGFYETAWYSEWILKFEALWYQLDWDCGCWGEYEWTWDIEWISLIEEFLGYMTCGCEPTTPPEPTTTETGCYGIYDFIAWFCSDESRCELYEAFMTWYFDLCGYTQWELLTEEECYDAIYICLQYMIYVVENPDCEPKPAPVNNPSLHITWDTCIYTMIYWGSFEGNAEFITMINEVASECEGLASNEGSGSGSGGGSGEGVSGEEPSEPGADYCVFICKYMAVTFGCWEDAEFQSEWSSFMIGVSVAKSQSTPEDCWAQLQMLINYMTQLICGWDVSGVTGATDAITSATTASA
ncbi:unnamed protein product, partial [Mesorhabditis spiculigera]